MGWFWQEKEQKVTPSEGLPPQPFEASSSLDPSTILSPQTILSTALLTSGLLLARTVYRYHLRRIPNNALLPSSLLSSPTSGSPSFIPSLRRQSLFGLPTHAQINDPDNFRFFHTPLGRLALWGTSLRPLPTSRAEFKNQTISVRLAGIDAPELAHFGKPAQPHAVEALKYLQKVIAERGKGRVRVFPLRRDQYERVVGTAFVRRRVLTLKEDGVFRRLFGGWRWGDERRQGLMGPIWHVNVGLDLVRKGWATVYEGKIGVEWGGEGMEKVYREAEKRAKAEKLGIWVDLKNAGVVKIAAPRSWSDVFLPWRWFSSSEKAAIGKAKAVETPREYKLRMKAAETEHVVPSKARVVKTGSKT